MLFYLHYLTSKKLQNLFLKLLLLFLLLSFFQITGKMFSPVLGKAKSGEIWKVCFIPNLDSMRLWMGLNLVKPVLSFLPSACFRVIWTWFSEKNLEIKIQLHNLWSTQCFTGLYICMWGVCVCVCVCVCVHIHARMCL